MMIPLLYENYIINFLDKLGLKYKKTDQEIKSIKTFDGNPIFRAFLNKDEIVIINRYFLKYREFENERLFFENKIKQLTTENELLHHYFQVYGKVIERDDEISIDGSVEAIREMNMVPIKFGTIVRGFNVFKIGLQSIENFPKIAESYGCGENDFTDIDLTNFKGDYYHFNSCKNLKTIIMPQQDKIFDFDAQDCDLEEFTTNETEFDLIALFGNKISHVNFTQNFEKRISVLKISFDENLNFLQLAIPKKTYIHGASRFTVHLNKLFENNDGSKLHFANVQTKLLEMGLNATF